MFPILWKLGVVNLRNISHQAPLFFQVQGTYFLPTKKN